jgi:hypothetical protein
MFDALSELQGGEGRLNFPLFSELLTPPLQPEELKGTGPFGTDYRLAEMAGQQRRRDDLDAKIAANPLMVRRASGTLDHTRLWRFEPGPPTASAPGAGPLLPYSKSVGSIPSALSVRAALEASGPSAARTIERSTYEIPDAPLRTGVSTKLMQRRQFAPRRSGAPAFSRGSHANLVEVVVESQMHISEGERLVRPAHFADKWDSKVDAARRRAIMAGRSARYAENESRVMGMVAERQASAELTDLCRSRAIGTQALWLMGRTVGQL